MKRKIDSIGSRGQENDRLLVVIFLQNSKSHAPDYVLVPATGISTRPIYNTSKPTAQLVNVQFAPNQHPPEQRKLGDLFKDRIQRKEFFYGIEMSARNFRPTPLTLDYNGFGAMLPLFTSVVWLGSEYWNVAPITNTESMRLAEQLMPHTIILPHFTCYRLTCKQVADLMAMNISNILVVRGDDVDREQGFKHTSELMAEIRKLRGDTISIGIAGHPEGHPDSDSFERDMEFLSKKVDAGADFIITQICFSSKLLIKFITGCRAKGITIPIIVGVFTPHNMQILQRMMDKARVRMDPDQICEYEARAGDETLFQEYAQQQSVEMVKEVFNSDLDIYGFQLYTMNNFKNAQQTLQKLLPEITVKKNDENSL